MPIHNAEVVDIFNEVVDLLELEGANRFRVRAYRNAAGTIGGTAQNLPDMAVSHTRRSFPSRTPPPDLKPAFSYNPPIE